MTLPHGDTHLIQLPSPPADAALGYARVSTAEQHFDLQVDAFSAVGCHRVFTDNASGAVAALAARPQLGRVLHQLRPAIS